MLTKETERKILHFVQKQPCSIQEIAKHTGKNWRTAENYVNKIIKENGAVSIRTFREGTRGALKIVYYNSRESINASEFQERLFQRIKIGSRKQDFSPLDLYNYVSEDKRSARCGSYTVSNELFNQDLVSFLRSAENQVLIFTGNCSFVSLQEKGISIFSIFQELAQRGVEIKVLTRVDFSSLRNLQQLLSINFGLGKEIIEIRHCEQPLRGFIVDESSLRLKEDLDPKDYAHGELPPNTRVVLYDIRDKEWVTWARDLFFSLFRSSISGQKRIKDLNSIRKQEKQALLT